MASELDICNLALARLGDNATLASIDPPEGSRQADHCARFYPIARDTLLEMHAWNFATATEWLTRVSNPPLRWSFAYAKPSETLTVLSVHSAPDVPPAEFEIEGDVILTNVLGALVKRIVRLKDTTKYSALFVDALSWLLASYLAGAMIKGDAGAKMANVCMQGFWPIFSRAMVSDANQSRVVMPFKPVWIERR